MPQSLVAVAALNQDVRAAALIAVGQVKVHVEKVVRVDVVVKANGLISRLSGFSREVVDEAPEEPRRDVGRAIAEIQANHGEQHGVTHQGLHHRVVRGLGDSGEGYTGTAVAPTLLEARHRLAVLFKRQGTRQMQEMVVRLLGKLET